MQRVQSNGQWSLFCPNEAPGLADCWGEEFEKLYTHYEREVNTVVPFVNASTFLHKYSVTKSSFVLNLGQGKEGCPSTEPVV